MMLGCNDPGCLLFPVVGLALWPVGAVVGSVGGYLTADKAEIVSDREIKIKNALAKLRMQENMHDKYISQLTTTTTFSFTDMPDVGPVTEDEKPDYRQFKSRGFSSVNEIDVKKLTLAGWGKVKPSLSVQLEVQVRLVSTTDNSEIYCKIFTCSSQAEKFEVWADQNAKKFSEEIESCYKDLADWSITDLYINDTIIGKNKFQKTREGGYIRQTTSACH